MVTMGDIAERAGVSRPTVSVILNERHSEIGIAEHTRRKVLAAAEELGYRRNELARAVKTGKSLTIGFLAGSTHLEYVSRLFSGALDGAEDRGYSLQRFRIGEESHNRKAVVRCVEHRLAGVIVCDPDFSLPLDFMQREFERHSLPTLMLDFKPSLPWGIGIASDDELGIQQAVQHLADLGHRRIAFCGAVEKHGSSASRLIGYQKAMRRCGMSEHMRILWEEGYGEQEERMRAVMSEAARPTALVCVSDAMALLSLRLLRGWGLEVPRDVSVVGFGDLLRTNLSDPALTTVAVPYEQIGGEAVCHLLGEVCSLQREVLHAPCDVIRADNDTQHYVPTRMMIRSSTAPPRADA